MAANTASPRMPNDEKKIPSVDTQEISSSIKSQTAVSTSLKLTHLSKADLKAVREAIGAPPIYYEEVDPRNPTAASRLAKKVPDGLYKTVLTVNKRASFRYFSIMILYNICVILQLVLGAILTALAAVGTSSLDKLGIAITVLAAANTVNAGLIALLHNSGFPGRLRSDMNEYSKVVEWYEYVMHAGVVDVGMSRDDVIQKAYDMYNQARSTVEKNQPTYYVGQTAPGAPGAPPGNTTPPELSS